MLIITYMKEAILHTVLAETDELLWYIKNTTVYAVRQAQTWKGD